MKQPDKATQPDQPKLSISAFQKKAVTWLKGLGIAAAVIAGLSIIVNLIGGIPSWSKGDGEWVTVTRVTCSPTWNNDRGWCVVVTDAAEGTYRVVPRYKSWELWQTDGSFISVPPYGLDLYAHWKAYEEVIDEFHRTAHKKGSNNVGALVIRVGDMEVLEALTSSRTPREFETVKNGTEISVAVNLPPRIDFYQYNKGEIAVEVQRQD